MKNRVALIKECGADFLVSIHQNSYNEENIPALRSFIIQVLWKAEKWRKLFRPASLQKLTRKTTVRQKKTAITIC